ncbi:MAG: cytochrome C [Burkholderiales bacterium]|nr:cytochrome C [Burkholderiales bacterium]
MRVVHGIGHCLARGWGVLALWLALALPALPVLAADASALPNTGCLSCHDGKSHKLEVPGPNGKPRALKGMSPDAYGTSVHAKMQCVACHTGITDNPAAGSGHKKEANAPAKSASCADCHQKLWDDAKKDNTAAAKPRLGVVADNIEAYKKSFHARPGKTDKTQPMASCDNCHDTHSFDIPAADTPARAQWRLKNPPSCGQECHTDQLETYTDSIHGKELLGKKNTKAAICSDCHTSHAVVNTSGDPFKLAVTAKCGSCHEANYKSYKATYHGKISTLGYAHTAKCYDCHGSHAVLAVKDKDSKVHPDNRMETCKECHNGKKGVSVASAGFASFQPHATTNNFSRYPQVWIGWQIMVGLLVGTFGFFWLHTALWFYRELKERKAGTLRPMVKLEALPPDLQGKHFMRFPAIWRVAHITFALSLMILSITGMPMFYPDAAWAPWVMQALGGPHVAGIIHRVCAIIFAGVFFWHLVYMLIGIWRTRATFRIFGPDSMIPGLQDLKDIIAMFRWFLGQAPRPVFDRWTYWEKFDYWAPFWGVTIIGVSGLMMWVPNLTATYLPGWVFNVAAIFHGEEAFLAVVFLFTVHFFNNHFRPDKFPVDIVMFTGTMSLEHLRREHPLQYKRLLDSGELKKYVVDAPSPPITLSAKLLAFALIALGLVILGGVAVGFFGGL